MACIARQKTPRQIYFACPLNAGYSLCLVPSTGRHSFALFRYGICSGQWAIPCMGPVWFQAQISKTNKQTFLPFQSTWNWLGEKYGNLLLITGRYICFIHSRFSVYLPKQIELFLFIASNWKNDFERSVSGNGKFNASNSISFFRSPQNGILLFSIHLICIDDCWYLFNKKKFYLNILKFLWNWPGSQPTTERTFTQNKLLTEKNIPWFWANWTNIERPYICSCACVWV